MKRISITFFLLFSLFSLTAQNIELKESVYFPDAEYYLSAEAQASLDQLVLNLAEFADFSLEIQAHTDSRGEKEYNQRLAENRAAAVQDYLFSQGVTTDNILSEAFGEENPLYNNEDTEGRRKNRRVDILVQAYSSLSFTEVNSQLQEDLVQKFTIDNSGKIQIIGREGTQIWINENSFVRADGTLPTGEVEVQLSECYVFEDMLRSGLMTKSGDRLLQTDGMIKVEAYAEGEKLQLAEDKDLTLAMPNDKFDKEMSLFTGAENAHEELSDWELSGTPLVTSAVATLRFADKPVRPITPDFDLIKYSPDSTFMPKIPVAPKRRVFREIKFPDTTKVYVSKGFLQSSKKYEEERRKKIDKMIARYNAKLKSRKRDVEAYEYQVSTYEKALTEYPEKFAAWEREQKTAADEYMSSDRRQQTIDFIQSNYDKAYANWKMKMDAYKRYRAKKAESFEKEYEKTGRASKESLSRYFFTLNTLGWINIDKFSKVKEWSPVVLQEDKPATEGAVYAVFEDLNSILHVSRDQEGNLINQEYPRNKEVTFLSWKVENGQPMLAKVKTKVGEQQVVQLNYKKVRLKDIREAMNM